MTDINFEAEARWLTGQRVSGCPCGGVCTECKKLKDIVAWGRSIAERSRCQDSNVEAIRQRLAQRSSKGMDVYGTTTERGDLGREEWLQHLQDELLDAAVYVEVLKRPFERKQDKPKLRVEHDGRQSYDSRELMLFIRQRGDFEKFKEFFAKRQVEPVDD